MSLQSMQSRRSKRVKEYIYLCVQGCLGVDAFTLWYHNTDTVRCASQSQCGTTVNVKYSIVFGAYRKLVLAFVRGGNCILLTWRCPMQSLLNQILWRGNFLSLHALRRAAVKRISIVFSQLSLPPGNGTESSYWTVP